MRLAGGLVSTEIKASDAKLNTIQATSDNIEALGDGILPFVKTV
jgi:hypothetical protein